MMIIRDDLIVILFYTFVLIPLALSVDRVNSSRRNKFTLIEADISDIPKNANQVAAPRSVAIDDQLCIDPIQFGTVYSGSCIGVEHDFCQGIFGDDEITCSFNHCGPGLHWDVYGYWFPWVDPFTFSITYYKAYTCRVYGCGSYECGSYDDVCDVCSECRDENCRPEFNGCDNEYLESVVEEMSKLEPDCYEFDLDCQCFDLWRYGHCVADKSGTFETACTQVTLFLNWWCAEDEKCGNSDLRRLTDDIIEIRDAYCKEANMEPPALNCQRLIPGLIPTPSPTDTASPDENDDDDCGLFGLFCEETCHDRFLGLDLFCPCGFLGRLLRQCNK